MHKNRTRPRAVAVAMTIIAATIFLGFLMSALFKVALMASNFNDRGLKETRAKFAALAAINRAFAELDNNPDWRAGWPDEEPLPQNPEIRYKLKVLEDVEMSLLGSTGSGKLASGADEVYLFAQGFTPEGAGTALAAMGGTAYRPGAQIAEACFADGDLIMEGGSADGFDSRLGDHWYNPLETNAGKQTVQALSGHVGGNDDIRIAGSRIDGDVVMPDPGSFRLGGTYFRRTSDIDVSSADILGSQRTPDSPREVAEVSVPFDDDSPTQVIDDTNYDSLLSSTVVPPAGEPTARVLAPGAYKSVLVPEGETLELQSGVYYFKNSLALDGAKITLNGSGPVKVFIGETFHASNAVVSPSQVDINNNNRKPAELQLLFADESEDPDTEENYSRMIVSNSTINAVAIGAKLRAQIDNSEFFGAVQADYIRAEGSNFHYDLALQDLEIDNFSKWKLRGLTALPSNTTL